MKKINKIHLTVTRRLLINDDYFRYHLFNIQTENAETQHH